jgi:hypothetical protein
MSSFDWQQWHSLKKFLSNPSFFYLKTYIALYKNIISKQEKWWPNHNSFLEAEMKAREEKVGGIVRDNIKRG